MPIDTLKAARRLQEDDTFSPEQAERIAEILSDLDVASATKDDLDDLEGRLTERIDEVETRLGDRIDQTNDRIDQTNDRIEQTNDRIDSLGDRIDRLDEKMATKAELTSVKSDLGKQIEKTHSATIRTLVGAVAAVGAILAVVIPLAIYWIG